MNSCNNKWNEMKYKKKIHKGGHFVHVNALYAEKKTGFHFAYLAINYNHAILLYFVLDFKLCTLSITKYN